jgi:hypothetical protein
MSEHTTRIVDLPENISMQQVPNMGQGQEQWHGHGQGRMADGGGIPSTNIGQGRMELPFTNNTRKDYDAQNTTYTPMNIHPNPMGNSLQPNVMPLPQQKYGGMNGGGGGGLDPMSELHNMPQVRLPSRDIPMDQSLYQQDEEIQPNYIPKPKLTNDYVREYEEAAEKSVKKNEKAKKQAEQMEDAMTDFQLPVIVAILFFIFQIPMVNQLLYKYLSGIPIFHSDGNLNFYGILLKSSLFGSAFFALQRLIIFIS